MGKQDLKNRWFQDWDNVAQVPYMSKDDRWVSYDNERSVEVKVRHDLENRRTFNVLT